MMRVGTPLLPPAAGLTWEYPRVNCGPLLELPSCNHDLCLSILSDVILSLKFSSHLSQNPKMVAVVEFKLCWWCELESHCCHQLQAWLGNILGWTVVDLCLELPSCTHGLCSSILSDVSLNLKITSLPKPAKWWQELNLNCLDESHCCHQVWPDLGWSKG